MVAVGDGYAVSEEHKELLREKLRVGSFFQQIFIDCFRFAGTMLVSWVTGGGGKTAELTIRMAQVPAQSFSILWI